MKNRDDTFDVDLSPRDIVLLKVRIDNPTAPVRELRDILDEKYDIQLSHNRVNELLREMSNEDVFREVVLPNEEIFNYYLFRIAFHYPNFEQKWEECYWELVEDSHVVMFFNADGYYNWQLLTQFNDDHEVERWVHHFFKKHGDLIAQFDNTKLPTVHKFHSEASIFDEMLWPSEEGREYLQNAQEDPHENGVMTADGGDEQRF